MNHEVQQSSVSPERDNSPVISRLCLAAHASFLGRGQLLLLGWDSKNCPTIAFSPDQVSTNAAESLKFAGPLGGLWLDGLKQEDIIPAEYIGVGKPIDRSNPAQQDVLSYSIKTNTGSMETVYVQELDMLKALVEHHCVWEDLNPQTVMAGDTIPTLRMHSVLLPFTDQQGGQKMWALAFPPVMKNESNEVMYQQFLVKTIQSLLLLDRQQSKENKRGYEMIVHNAVTLQDHEGSDAYVIMKRLVDAGLYDMTREQLNALRERSSGKGFGQQLLLLGHQFGIFDLDEPLDTSAQQLEQLSVDQLADVVSSMYHVARSALSRF